MSAQSDRNPLGSPPQKMQEGEVIFHVGNHEFQSVDAFFNFIKDLPNTVTAEDLPSTYASIGADLLRSCDIAVEFMNGVVAQFVDLVEGQCPQFTEANWLKSNKYEEAWNTLRNIRATEKSRRVRKETGQRERIVERWGDATKYLFAKEPGQKFIQVLDALSTLYPDWQVARHFINHVLLERRRRPVTGQNFDLRPGVADAIRASHLATKVHQDDSVIPEMTAEDINEFYRTSKIRLRFNEWGLLETSV